MYNKLKNIVLNFVSRVYEIFLLQIKSKKVEDTEDEDEEKIILINSFMEQ
jgi:hypothetical protein